jgi:tetratricopeptide (TPR) repeat protein
MSSETLKQRLDRCLREVESRPESPSAHFNLGLAYTQQGLTDSAERAYRKALELNPDLVEAWVNLGGSLLLKWDFPGAKQANEEALKRRDDTLLAHYNLGQSCLYLGDAEGVVRCNKRVVELDPNHPAGHYNLAVGLLATGRIPEAREELTRASALGHRPSPEFLRALERTEKQAEAGDHSTDIPGAEAPDDTKEA